MYRVAVENIVRGARSDSLYSSMLLLVLLFKRVCVCVILYLESKE